MVGEPQTCSDQRCGNPAAFKTRTKAAWCDEHITALLAAGGLVPLEPFVSPKAYRLTRCTSCGCEAHYRLEYVLDQNTLGVGTCRACFWRAWGAHQRRVLEGFVNFSPVPIAEVKAHAEANGYEYLGPLTHPPLRHDPHRASPRPKWWSRPTRSADSGVRKDIIRASRL